MFGELLSIVGLYCLFKNLKTVLIIYYNYLLILTFFYERVLVYDLLFLLYFSIYFFHFLLHLFLNENVENIIYDLFISIFL